MVYYLLYNSAVGFYEYEITEDYIFVGMNSYQIIYFFKTDRLIVRLKGLGVFLNMFDAPYYLDIEAKVSNYVLDALEKLLRESIVIYEEVN